MALVKKKRPIGQWNRIEKPEKYLHKDSQWIFDRGDGDAKQRKERKCKVEMTDFSINGSGTRMSICKQKKKHSNTNANRQEE